MKNNIFVILIFAFVAILLFFYVGADGEYVVDKSDHIDTVELGISTEYNENINSSLLTEIEKRGLIYVREEEKLARDVYSYLYDKWALNIFSNIAKSEQTHTDAVKVVLEKYGLNDPVDDDARGVFKNKEIEKLYKELTEKGEQSLADALLIGAVIEDMDIYDINGFLNKSKNEDIKLLYTNLIKGSRNHLRAFSKQLSSRGTKYEAQYLTQDVVDEILSGSQEKGYIKL